MNLKFESKDPRFYPTLNPGTKEPDLPFVLRRRQPPVKLAWCMTFNKAQGQTLKRVGIYLSSPVFSHGQLYVGLSRAGCSSCVKVVVEDGDTQGYYKGHDAIEEEKHSANINIGVAVDKSMKE